MDTAYRSNLAQTATAEATPQLRTVLLCDLVDSTGLLERLGDVRAADLLRKHDGLVRRLLAEHGGRGIDKSDGFLALFDRPIRAVGFALAYQRELRGLGESEQVKLTARAGIHVGDVMVWENAREDVARGAKPLEVEGLAKPVAARLMTLALPGQILLSGVAQTLAHRAEAELGTLAGRVRWPTHGRYHFKGVPAPMLVHEVGEPGHAPLRAPPSGEKAWRDVPVWRRPLTLALEAGALAALIGATAYFSLRSTPAIAFRERDWVVVGDLNNLTGDARFEDALETALRITLEQSRHVNVLPELRVRDTLKRMGREAGATVDRGIAAEIAQREGARAVLLPTLAEVGGRIRFSLEVVDPASQATVFAESADGVGADSTLGSVGKASERLRERLGEALASVEQSSAPVEKVTSSSLDALRAYTLGNKANVFGHQKEAEEHYQQALSLDHEFALAHIGMAKILFSRDAEPEALIYAKRAAAMPGRLSDRERLYVNAWLATLERRKDYAMKWRALADLYPDFHTAAHNYSLFTWFANRYAESLKYAERAAAPQSATRAVSTYRVGIAQLGLERYADAVKGFKTAASLGYSGEGILAAGAFAATRRYREARETLNASPAMNQLVALERRLMELAMLADQGRWSEATVVADALHENAAQWPTHLSFTAEASALAVSRGAEQAPLRRERIRALISRVRSALPKLEHANRERAVMALLYAGYLAAREGDVALAREASAIAAQDARDAPLPTLVHMRVIISARIALTGNDYEEARRELSGLFNGNELCLTHALAAEAEFGLGNHRDALRHLDWLREHRGRAYAEFGYTQLLVENTIQVNRALLRAAEVAQATGDGPGARRYLAEFNRVWPSLEAVPDLQARSDAIAAGVAKR